MDLRTMSIEELQHQYSLLDVKIREIAKWGPAMEAAEREQTRISIEIGRRRREGQ